jgi:hypothetical protein
VAGDAPAREAAPCAGPSPHGNQHPNPPSGRSDDFQSTSLANQTTTHRCSGKRERSRSGRPAVIHTRPCTYHHVPHVPFPFRHPTGIHACMTSRTYLVTLVDIHIKDVGPFGKTRPNVLREKGQHEGAQAVNHACTHADEPQRARLHTLRCWSTHLQLVDHPHHHTCKFTRRGHKTMSRTRCVEVFVVIVMVPLTHPCTYNNTPTIEIADGYTRPNNQ